MTLSPEKKESCKLCRETSPGIIDGLCYHCKEAREAIHDPVEHPTHYTAHPSGIECIQITEHMSFTLGNAVKYIWRADLKGGLEDLRKAAWYINREIERRKDP